MNAHTRNAKKAEPIIRQSFRAGMTIGQTSRAIKAHPDTLKRYCITLGIKLPQKGSKKRKGLVSRIIKAIMG